MSWLSSFMHPEKGYQAAQDQLNQYYGQAQGYQQPYTQQGQSAYGDLSGAMQQLLNPQALQDKWIGSYQESEAAKDAERRAQEHGLNAASSMGLMGATPTLSAIQAGTSEISNADRQQYLNDLMQKYLAGTGVAQGIYSTGAQSASQMGQNAMNMGQNSAQMAYGQANAQGNLLGNLLGMGTGLLGSYLGGSNKNYNSTPWMIGGS